MTPVLARVQRLLASRFAGPLALSLALTVLVTNEAGFHSTSHISAQRDGAVALRQAVSQLRHDVLTMETSKRGYMLTGRPEYREPFNAGSRLIDQTLDRVRAIAATGDATQRALLEQLVDLVEDKRSEMREVLRLFDAGNSEGAMELMLTDIGREHMERIDRIVEQILDAERGAYAASGRRLESVRQWSRLAISVLVLVCLGAVFAGMRIVRERDADRRRHLADVAAERNRLDDQVRERTLELEALARHLQTVREDERGRLARELHDELGGLLTAAKLDVARMRKRLPPEAPELAERVAHLSSTLDVGIALKRRIIEDLRPPALDDLGLSRTLQILCDEFAQRAELPVDTALDEVAPGSERALAIYRLVQEALTNVAKYARARRVQVVLRAEPDGVVVEVADDGDGFDPASVRPGSHGLAGMRFRIRSAGGEFSVDSAPGQGTRVRARLPL